MPKYQLQLRDIDILKGVSQHRYLTRRLIWHLPLEHGDLSSLQVTNRRIRALLQEKTIEEFQVTGIPEALIRVTKAGIQYFAEPDEVVSVLKNRPVNKPKNHLFVRHFLLTNAFWIALSRYCRSSQSTLKGFIPYFQGGKPEYIRDETLDILYQEEEIIKHTPDAAYCIRNNSSALYFVEIDRGTEDLRNPNRGVFKFIRFYLGYLAQRKHQRYEKDFKSSFPAFRVLILTTKPARVKNILDAMGELIPAKFKKATKFFRIASISEDDPVENILDVMEKPVWRSLDHLDEERYSFR